MGASSLPGQHKGLALDVSRLFSLLALLQLLQATRPFDMALPPNNCQCSAWSALVYASSAISDVAPKPLLLRERERENYNALASQQV